MAKGGGPRYYTKVNKERLIPMDNWREQTMDMMGKGMCSEKALKAGIRVPECIKYDIFGNKFNMIHVHSGAYIRSRKAEEEWYDEIPPHKVTLTGDYYVADIPVTRALWFSIMGYYPEKIGYEPFKENEEKWRCDQLPVNELGWYECWKFIKLLRQKTGLCFRMLTSAEWEYALRAGYGLKCNRYDFLNENGAILEWCADGWSIYRAEDITNPLADFGEDPEVNEGNGESSYFAIKCLTDDDPTERHYGSWWRRIGGLRLARSLSPITYTIVNDE